ncbi:amidase [Sedimentitalea sp. JM2-8]|uniref:Amidase n=1 Tax=Sedimentitalea xiamensis TaxID=3050037 RepID=A0ABT7FCF6_9RHOB|nr:amidase [Sedimentitalea xiamensis]MDK3072784.1 amidase [Sedimentitalea xiamensis]
MSSHNLHFKTLLEVGRMIHGGDMTAAAVTDRMLDRIAAVDPQFQSYVRVCADRARDQAQMADADMAKGIFKGPLHGVPIAVKDLCYTTYAPTGAGTIIHADFMPAYNATVVDRLEAAGAVILGKLTMTEGAYTSHHPQIPTPPNPWNPDYWVGSSSTGSGVATSAGLCFASLGSDTGGSIRFPCATCGLTGIKPTWGRVSRHGVFALAESLDHIGPMARSAADCAVMLQAIAGWDAQDPTTLDTPVPDYADALGKPVRGMRIGIDRSYCLDGVDPDVASALEQAVAVFEAQGARIVEVALPPHEELVATWIMMCAIETAVAHKDTYPRRAGEYGPDLAQLIDEGRVATGMDAARGHHLRLAFTGALSTMFNGVDCMLCPTMPMPTPSLVDMAQFGEEPDVLNAILRYTAPFDFSGSPTVTLPNGVDRAGMPLSMQIVGPRLGEATLIRAADAYQRATDWHTRAPPMS